MEVRRNVMTGIHTGRLELTDGTTVEWMHDSGRDMDIKPSRELTQLETDIVLELIDGTPLQTILTGAEAGPIVEGITRAEEGETGDAEPFKGTWAEFVRLEEIREEIIEASGDTHPYELEPTAELTMNWENSDVNLIERATGIKVD